MQPRPTNANSADLCTYPSRGDDARSHGYACAAYVDVTAGGLRPLESVSDRGGATRPPKLLHVSPAQVVPGDEAGIVAMDGYLRWDNECGTFQLESARTFELFFDGVSAGSLLCYAGRCQATLAVPVDTSPGTHAISVEGGSGIHVEVAEEGHDLYEPNDTREQVTVMQRPTVSGYIGHSEDVDIFRTPAAYGGYLLDFSVELYDLPADYDLYVYDSANREIARSTNRGTEPEHIYYYSGPRTGNSYWLKVVGADGASDPNRPYRLRFTMNPGTRTPSPTRTPTVLPTATPDPCTGWRCVVTGVVYAGTAQPGDELAGATITLHHTSYCSPTSGVHQAKTGPTALLNSAMCSCTTRIESRSKSNPRGTNPPSGTLSIATASTVVALGIRSRLCCAQCQVHKKNGVVAHYLTSGYTPRTKRTGMASC